MGVWNARWISYAFDPRQDLGVFVFRRRLPESAGSILVKVSADQRYKLFVNDRFLGFGPQRGDLRHWFYETYDLSPFLSEGENTVWALVWNFGWMAPMAQHSARTAFVLDGPGIFTPDGWEVARLDGWGFDMMHSGVDEFYIDVGPGEILDARGIPARLWETDELAWRKPHSVARAEERGASGGGTPWMLVPRSLPPMRREASIVKPILRRAAPHVYDYGELLTAYPRVTVRGPAGARAVLTYSESMWTPEGGKRHRATVEGMDVRGYQDVLICDGTERSFEPLWWRTYRFLQIEADPGVEIVKLEALDTGYPLVAESKFEANGETERIWDVSFRTALRCAGENYFDCPYYEQLQYAGDTRIQALIGYYLGRDRALQRNAVESLSWSIMENGLPQSRYPSRQTQVIPPFGIWWVLMVLDQALYDEPLALDLRLRQIDGVISAIQDLITSDRDLDGYWWFADWIPGWWAGEPPGGKRDAIHLLTLALACFARERLQGRTGWTRQDFEDDLRRWGLGMLKYEEGLWRSSASGTPTEHAEALYRCCELLTGLEPSPWPAEELEREDAAKCTYYFSYYKHVATPAHDYHAQLQPWRQMLDLGLSTFAENPEPTRSDCHAWSAHPILGFMQKVAGVTSSGWGWNRALVRPHPGGFGSFKAKLSHPRGVLKVHLDGGRLRLTSPVPLSVQWAGKLVDLPSGHHEI